MNLRLLSLGIALAVAVPALAQDSSFSFAQADYPPPGNAEGAVDSNIAPDQTELAALKDIYLHIDAARRARLGGDVDKAKVEDKITADQIMSFLKKYPNHRLRIVMAKSAAERYLNVGDWEAAANAAQQIVQDPKANDLSRAVGSRYALGGWQMTAVQEMKAGKIPQLKLVFSGNRGGAAPSPRPVDLAWRMFVENTDTYAKVASADPTNKLPPDERRAAGGVDLPQVQILAAQVEFSYDNIEDAQRRFAALIAQNPGRADVLETAVPMYLDTFRILKDPKGLEAAIARIEPVVEAEAKKAADAAAAPGATEQQKKDAAILKKLAAELHDSAKGGDYNAAAALLAKGDALVKEGKAADATAQYRQAAQLFEKFASENQGSADAANALFNAALAWDKAKEGKQANADREKLVAAYPDAKVTPQTVALLGGTLAASRDYAGAAKYNQMYLSRWPTGPARCAVLQNLGLAQQETKKTADATQTYLTFANDPACSAEDPNVTARILYSAAKLQVDQKKMADAKKTFQQLVALKGVTDVVGKSYQADAKERLSKMK
jgi:tetratricopeptide (TPR) repeat protein